ncbi:MAG TPA: hypothetical protein VGN07_22495 [Steroidobacteraceae bacterium]|jgi:hypothetical protein
MRRRLVALRLFSFIGVGSAAAAPLPLYHYSLEVSTKQELCSHFDALFNEKFSHLWDTDRAWTNSELRPEVQRRYAFPTLPGLESQLDFTFEMRYSKLPSSREFEAIPWSEGRWSSVGSQDGHGGVAERLVEPVLVARLDIDNDGTIDTVMKVGFTEGYPRLVSPEGASSEYVWVWRGRNVSDLTLDPRLLEKMPIADRPASITPAAYQRPLVYRGRAYLARYQIILRRPDDVKSELMTILELRDNGKIDEAAQRPLFDEETVCRFAMTHVGASANGGKN